jgi:hypothetical protein
LGRSATQKKKISGSKTSKTEWAEHLAGIGEKINSYKIWTENVYSILTYSVH